MLVSFCRVARSHDAATHAHNGVFSLWPHPTTLDFPSSFALRSVVPFFFQLPLPIYLFYPILPPSVFWFFIFFLSISIPFTVPFLKTLCSSIHPFLHPTAHFPCGWLTGRFIRPQGGHITPQWMGERSKRVDVLRVCKSECVPAVWQCSATWTEAWAGTSSVAQGLLIQSHHWCVCVCMYSAVRKY